MRALRQTRQIRRGAWDRFFRVAYLISVCALFITCSQTKDDPPKPPAETRKASADQPRVVQIDDAKIKEIVKPNGKPLLVNFWATWCGPCREEFPDLVEIDAEYKGKIDFITITLDFAEELNTGVPQFLDEMKAEMPTYLLVSADENKLIPSISKDWSGALPFTILYNEKGETTYTRQGKVDIPMLKAEIENTVGEN